MSKSLTNLARLAPRPLKLIDIGARSGIQAPWIALREFVGLITFEPDREEFQALQATKRPSDQIFNTALAESAREKALLLTASRGCSSLYEPNGEFLNQFPDFSRFAVEKTVPMVTETLDSLLDNGRLEGFDFAKIDVQGAELDILKGGKKSLSDNALGLEVEVEFQPIYKGQPLFADVDQFVRTELGLELQDLRKTYWKYPEGRGIGGTKGKLIFGDALYLRAPEALVAQCARLSQTQAAEKFQLACLVGVAYGCLDYSLRILAQTEVQEQLGPEVTGAWHGAIKIHGRCLSYHGRFARPLAYLFELLYRSVQPMHEEWASVGQPLGHRKRFGVFL